MRENKYIQVLWVEDDPLITSAYPNEADMVAGIELHPFPCWEDAEIELENNYGRWDGTFCSRFLLYKLCMLYIKFIICLKKCYLIIFFDIFTCIFKAFIRIVHNIMLCTNFMENPHQFFIVLAYYIIAVSIIPYIVFR